MIYSTSYCINSNIANIAISNSARFFFGYTSRPIGGPTYWQNWQGHHYNHLKKDTFFGHNAFFVSQHMKRYRCALKFRAVFFVWYLNYLQKSLHRKNEKLTNALSIIRISSYIPTYYLTYVLVMTSILDIIYRMINCHKEPY